jgi:hypothetical protein
MSDLIQHQHQAKWTHELDAVAVEDVGSDRLVIDSPVAAAAAAAAVVARTSSILAVSLQP